MDWNKILNWKLLAGSHKFPGPDGGTCINEAAIIAAGFKYNAVASADDCPPCFSRVLSAYAISLNDRLSDDRRQELLMPFVTRIAGTADIPEIERQRFDFIMLGIIQTIMPIALRGWKDDLASECERVENYDQAIEVVNKIARDLDKAAVAATIAGCLANDLDLARIVARNFHVGLDLAGRIVARNFDVGRAVALGLDKAAVALLNGAMKIGKQAEPIETEIVIGRLAKIRIQRELVL